MLPKNTFVSAWEILPVAIASGSALSEVINLGGLRLFGIAMPSIWTAANLTFQMSPDAGATWCDMIDQNGNEILGVATAGTYVAMNNPLHFAPAQYLRIRSGASSAPVTQAAGRTLQLLLRGI